MYSKLALGNIRKSLRDFGIYFLTCVLGIAVFYAFNAIGEQEATSAIKIMGILGVLINGVSIFIAVILFFLMMYASRFLLRRRKKEFGLYLCLGMYRSDVVKITLIETLVTGIASLVVGIVLGLGISQLLMMLNAALFQVEVPGFVASISQTALSKTVFVFAAIFLVSAIMNSGSIMKSKLIDLLQASRKNEVLRLRSLPLSLLLFIVSCILIGISYWLLLTNGLMDISAGFFGATILVCIGTVLFFYSLSGFLLRFVQMIKPLYLRGLNMFTLRQLNSKVNTTFVSMSIICMTLFLAITSVCGGIGICNALTSNIDKTTAYDATVRTYYGLYDTSADAQGNEDSPFGEFVQSYDYDMMAGIKASAATLGTENPGELTTDYVQLDYLVDREAPITFGFLDTLADRPLSDYTGPAVSSDYGEQTLDLLPLSKVNATLKLAGKEPLDLPKGTCVIATDSDIAHEYLANIVSKQPTFAVGGESLRLTGLFETCLETTSVPQNVGTLIVPDEAIPANTRITYSTLNVQCPSEEAEEALGALCETIQTSNNPQTWPISVVTTKTDTRDQSVGLSTIVAYLAIYIGFVLVVACAAILAIQQLSEASDNASRYRLLNKLGAPKSMLNHALFIQIAICFLFPLALAIAHSICALQVVTQVVVIFGHIDIGFMAIVCTAAFVATYGVYFLFTYLGAKNLIKTS